MRDFFNQRYRKLWLSAWLCAIVVCLVACRKNPSDRATSPTPDLGRTVTNTPKPTESPLLTENPSAALREAAAWEEGDLISEELLFDQCNAMRDEFLPIMDDGNDYIVLSDYLMHVTRGLYRCDKQTGEMRYFCNVSDCKHEGEDTCVSTNRKYWYHRILTYDRQLYVVGCRMGDGDPIVRLFTIPLDGTAIHEVTTIYEPIGTDKCYCVEVVIHNGYVITVLLQVGAEETYRVCTTDLRTGKSEMIWEITYPSPSDDTTLLYTRYLNAYHNVLFFMADVDGKNTLFRYDLKNGRMIDSKKLAMIRPYMVLDEDRVLFVNNGLLLLHDFDKDVTRIQEVSLPDPEPKNAYFDALVGSVHCYKDYVIVSEWWYNTNETGFDPEAVDYYVFTKDLKEKIGVFRVPLDLEEWNRPVVKKPTPPNQIRGWIKHREILFFKDDIVYSQNRLTGVAIAARFEELLEGKGTWTEVFDTRTIDIKNR